MPIALTSVVAGFPGKSPGSGSDCRKSPGSRRPAWRREEQAASGPRSTFHEGHGTRVNRIRCREEQENVGNISGHGNLSEHEFTAEEGYFSVTGKHCVSSEVQTGSFRTIQINARL
jgi:hypothetical protein